MSNNVYHEATITPPATTEARSPAQEIPKKPHEEGNKSTPVEMSSLNKDSAMTSRLDRTETNEEEERDRLGENKAGPSKHVTPRQPPSGPTRTDTNTALLQAQNPPATAPPSSPGKLQKITTTAIGPSTDQPLSPRSDSETVGPALMITLLLTNGARHPFRLDARYLAKRNVKVQDSDPFNLSVYKLKELILREWRDEWEAKPSSPNFIRLISFGKLLDDKSPLKDNRFNHESPNVVHMTIKPQDFVDEDDAKGAKHSHDHRSDEEGRSHGCRCIVM